MNIQERIKKLSQGLSHQVFEKEKIIRLALLSAIAGESVFLLGPPGVAKSMIARRLKYAFKDAKSFEYLMGKFSTPDEVFGPVSISKLKDEDKYERLTEHYLPGANIVFLDEIWKASPPIQNALLTVLNEKIYRNGEQELQVDIRGLISASNELPLKGEGLEALWDRFLLRLTVGNIEEENLFNQLLALSGKTAYDDPVEEEVKISDEEYQRWSEAIRQVELPSHILGLINHLRRSIRQRNQTADIDNQMYVSDRRWQKIAHLLRTSAFLNGRNEIHVMDCFLIADCIWDQLEQSEEAHALVLGSIANFGYHRLVNLGPMRREVNDLWEEITAETRIVEEETVPILKVYRDRAGNAFYAMPDFWKEGTVFVRASDYEKLKVDKKGMIPILENGGKQIFRVFQTVPVVFHSEFVLNHKGRDVQFETQDETREIITEKVPTEAYRKIWDSQISLMLNHCEQGIKTVEERKKIDEPYLMDHLFVSDTLAEHVMDSLHTTTNELLNLKLEIEKVRHSYESINPD